MANYAAVLVAALWLCVFQSVANAQSSSYAMWFQPGVTITKASKLHRHQDNISNVNKLSSSQAPWLYLHSLMEQESTLYGPV